MIELKELLINIGITFEQMKKSSKGSL